MLQRMPNTSAGRKDASLKKHQIIYNDRSYKYSDIDTSISLFHEGKVTLMARKRP